MVALWRTGIALVSIIEVNLLWARLVLGWVSLSWFIIPGAGHLFRYVTSNPGQLSLTIK